MHTHIVITVVIIRIDLVVRPTAAVAARAIIVFTVPQHSTSLPAFLGGFRTGCAVADAFGELPSGAKCLITFP